MNPSPTAKSLLVNWTNHQEHWIRGVVTEIIATRRNLSSSRIDHHYEILLIEKDLKAGQKLSPINLADEVLASDQIQNLSLASISEVKNANALAPRQTLEFCNKMNIIFGENASGKTGYVRILKRTASVRSAEDILPNLSDPNATTAPPSATIKYFLNDQPGSLNWSGEVGVHPLTRIDIFDSRFTNIHVDEDLTYLFTPGELALFPMVQRALDGVKGKLESAVLEISNKINPFLPMIPKTCSFYKEIENLGAASNLEQLEALAILDSDIQQMIANLNEDISALRSSNPLTEIKLLDTSEQGLVKIRNQLAIFTQFDPIIYHGLLDNIRQNQSNHDQLSKSSLSQFEIPGLLEDHWKQFIYSGETYIHSHLKGQYPTEGDRCIYCLQDLESAALSLIKEYRQYCSNHSKQKLDDSKANLETWLRTFNEITHSQLSDTVSQIPAAGGKNALHSTITSAIHTISAIEKALRERANVADDLSFDTISDALKFIELELENIKNIKNDLQTRSVERESALKIREHELIDLLARTELQKLMPQIKEYFENAKWADSAVVQLKKFQGIFKSLTHASKMASDQLLNQDFESKFEKECELLKAPKVQVQFPGKQGQVARRKTISEKFNLSDILSEGEQKAIALADFLAEAHLRSTNAPIVFDDPVNSLDYKRMEYVAQRLASLSQERQVIIFTHNIWFVTELLGNFESGPQGDCNYYHVQSDGTTRGIISRGSGPRTDTYNSLKGKINQLIQSAGSATGESQQVLIEKAYDYLRSLCEVVVESELLQGVTKRYQPNVRMTNLDKIKCDKLPDAIQAIQPIFVKCCRQIAGHSQPLETLNVRPELTDLSKDFSIVTTAYETYKNAK